MLNQEQEEDEDPFTTLLNEDQENNNTTTEESELHDGESMTQLQKHYLRSINSTVVIRQLPSKGLSFQLWPAATTLVTLLDGCNLSNSPLSPTLYSLTNDSNGRPLNILELGSGTGLLGISAAVTLGAKVTVTDLPHVIPNLQFNVDANAAVLAANGGVINVAPLRWGEEEDVKLIGNEFDLILASDVVYHDNLYEPLLQTLNWLLGGKEKKVFVMAHLRRWKKDSVFFKKAKKAFEVDVLHVDSPCNGSRTGVIVYRFAGRLSRNLCNGHQQTNA